MQFPGTFNSSDTFNSSFGMNKGTNQTSSLFGTKSLFGTTPVRQANPFGQTTQQTNPQGSLFSTGFGTTQNAQPQQGLTMQNQQGSLFSSNFPAQQTQMISGTTIKLDPVKATDTMVRNNETKTINTKLMCISAMKQYENKCLEELRVDDYIANRKSKQQQAGSFFSTQNTAVNTNTVQPTTNSLFGQTQPQQQKPSLFGNPATATQSATNVFGQPQPAQQAPGTLSLFGTNTQQPQQTKSLFGTTQPTATGTGAFGQSAQPASTGGGLFGQKTTMFPSAQPSTLGGGVFGQQQQQQSTLGGAQTGGLFGTQNTVNTGQPTSTVFGQPQQQKPSLFGNPATATQSATNVFGQPQPAQQAPGTLSLFGNTQQQQTKSLFGTTQPTATATGAFGQPQPASTGGGLFGQKTTMFPSAQPSTLGGGIFGQQQQQQSTLGAAQTGGLFGSQNKTLFSGQPDNSAANAVNPNAFPNLVVGTEVSIGIQQAIIDAQLSSLPYGDSPFLKIKSPKNGETVKSSQNFLAERQRMIRFMGDSSKPDKDLAHNSSIGLNSSNALMGADLSSTSSNARFSYKPLVNLPSVGFGAALGLDTSNSSSRYCLSNPGSTRTRSFLAQDTSSQALGDVTNSSISRTLPIRKVKALDVSILHKSESNNQADLMSSPAIPSMTTSNPTENLPILHSPITTRKQVDQTPNISSPNVHSTVTTTDTPRYSADTPTTKKSNENNSTIASIQQSSPANVNVSNNSTQIVNVSRVDSLPNKIKLSRPEYYSNPSIDQLNEQFEDGLLNLEEGLTVGRVGFGSVFWPGPLQLAPIDLDEIVHIEQNQVIVYPNELTKPKVGVDLNRPAEVNLEKIWPLGKNKQLIKDPSELVRLRFREKLERMSRRLGAEFIDYQPVSGSWKFKVPHFSKYAYEQDDDDEEELMDAVPSENLPRSKKTFNGLKNLKTELAEFNQNTEERPYEEDMEFFSKKFKFDESINSIGFVKSESNILSQVIPKAPVLVEREPVNVIAGLPYEILQNPMVNMLRNKIDRKNPNLLRSCRVGFNKNFQMVSSLPQQFSTSITISKVSIVPCVWDYIQVHLKGNNRLNELGSFQCSEMFQSNPPSTFLKLIDRFITSTKPGDEIKIYDMCNALLIPPSKEQEICQRIQFGNWLSEMLKPKCHTIISENKFFVIYTYLVNGAVQQAIETARDAKYYNLAMIISMYKCPAAPLIQHQMAAQLVSIKKNQHAKINPYYKKILQLLDSSWVIEKENFNSTNCLTGLNWMQVLGVLIWYWSRPATTLNDCVQLLENFIKKQIVNINDL